MTGNSCGVGIGGLGVLLALSACVSTHPAAPSAPGQSATSTVVAAPAPDPSATADRPAPDTGDAGTPATTTNSCVCAETPAKPKPKLKPKVVRQEAPPQLPASVAEHTPPGALIDAQVASMSVPVMSILGKRVRGAQGEDLGRVVDVLADASGRVRTAIIDFGGFLGVGNHRVAVDWPLLRFNADASDPSLLLSLSPEKLRTAPEYKDNPRPQILTVPTASTHAPAD